METLTIDLKKKKSFEIGQQGDHNALCIHFINMKNVGTNKRYIYYTIDGIENCVPLTNDRFIVGYPLTAHSGIASAQLISKLNDNSIIKLSNVFAMHIKESKGYKDSGEYPVDPNIQSSYDLLDDLINETKDLINNYNYATLMEKLTQASSEATTSATTAKKCADELKNSTDFINTLDDKVAAQDSKIEKIEDSASHITTKQNKKIAALQTRMSEFTSLKDGSTTGDAELIDARIGADGTKYPSAGDAMRGQVEQLNEALVALEDNLSVQNNIANPSKVVKGSVYIKPTQIQEVATWFRIEIPVSPNTLYTMWGLDEYCWFSNDDGSVYSNINKLGGLFTTPPNCTKLLLSNTTGKFYVVNGNFTNNKNYGKDIPYGVVSSVIDRLENKINISNYSKILLSNTNFTNGKFLTYNSGIEVINDTYCYTDYVRTNEKTLYYTNNKMQYQICFYDKDFKYISGKTGKYIFETPKNTYYSRISIPISLKNEIYINEFKPLILKVGVNEEFTKIKDAVEFAIKYPNTTLHIKKGTYDLIEEFGSETLESMSSGSGIELRNGIHIICDEGSIIKCNYNGNNDYIKHEFSAFNSLTEYIDTTESLSFGITVENMTLECSNIRYAIHDEHGGSNVPYKNVYERCSIKLDNTNNTWQGSQCIGGGLGQHADIQVKDCTFISIASVIDDGKIPAVSWHNDTINSIAKSRIVVSNCYFKGENNTFRAGYCGASKEKSEFIISNNNMAIEPYLKEELAGSENVNIELVSFNNFIRTN